jgi:S-formylglutathione hydrolase FrmB
MLKLVIIFLIAAVNVFTQSTVINTSFYSSILNENRNIQIILPPGYENGNADYPVIYFLHGANSNSTGYSEVLNASDILYQSASISKYIIVKPNAYAGPYLGSFYSNSDLYGNFENYIISDVTAFVEDKYRVKQGRENRFLAGHSMGGFGAMKLALKYPEMFAAAASHSGPLDFNNFNAQLPFVLYETGVRAPYKYSPQNGIFSMLFYSMAGAFSPNLDKDHYVDIPLDSDGKFIDSIMAKWMPHNPSGLVRQLRSDLPAIYFDCGTFDELSLFVHNTGFRDSLIISGLSYVFESYTGFHSNKLSDRLQRSFLFIDSVYKSRIASVKDVHFKPEEFQLMQNYPNPFNPSTEIKVVLPEDSRLSLRVYNILGKEIETLVNEHRSAGIYTFSFTAENYSNGVYFCKMETEGYSSVIKMVLLK